MQANNKNNKHAAEPKTMHMKKIMQEIMQEINQRQKKTMDK